MLVFFSLFTALLLVVIDYLTKALVVLKVKPVGDITVIEGWLKWSYRENTGAAFSMFSDSRYIFLISTTVLMALCLYLLFFKYRTNGLMCFIFALILGGGAGNMIDRVALGYVVDFIHLSFFSAIFNFADCCVTLGASILSVVIIISMVKEHQENRKKQAETPEES